VAGSVAPQARLLGAVEADRGVDAVLQHEERALPRERGQPLGALVGEVATGGVLSGGPQRDELDLVASEDALERVHVEPTLSMPTASMRAPLWCSEAGALTKVGDSTTATSPRRSSAPVTRSIPWRGPDTTCSSSRSVANPDAAPRLAGCSRSSGNPPESMYPSASRPTSSRPRR